VILCVVAEGEDFGTTRRVGGLFKGVQNWFKNGMILICLVVYGTLSIAIGVLNSARSNEHEHIHDES